MLSPLFLMLCVAEVKDHRPLDLDDTMIDIVREMTKIPPALKAWRGPVTELLNDNRFFNSNAETAAKWKIVMKALFDTDKTAFPELLGEVMVFCYVEEALLTSANEQAKSLRFLLQIYLLIEITRCYCDRRISDGSLMSCSQERITIFSHISRLYRRNSLMYSRMSLLPSFTAKCICVFESFCVGYLHTV